MLVALERRTQFIVLSKGERQSREFMEKVSNFCRALKELKQLPEFEEIPEIEMKAMEVRFPHNGSRILGLPANPDTARGYSGNVILDEFAMHADAREIYAAIYPSITRGFSLEILSTPKGQQGKFFELAKQAGLVEGFPRDPASPWSAHRVTVYDAVAQGLKLNLARLRAGCDDEETWRQEYECEFVSDAENYIPLELILACTSEAARTDYPPELLRGRALFLGVDIGRRRDLTVMWLDELVGDVAWTRRVAVFQKATFEVQERALNDLMALGVRRAAIDASGIGMMLAERAVKRYGQLIEPVTFTAQIKEKLAPELKRAFEERRVRIPDDRAIRADLNAVKRFVTPAGNIRFDAERSDRGHADRFWAKALAHYAAAGIGLATDYRAAETSLAAEAARGYASAMGAGALFGAF